MSPLEKRRADSVSKAEMLNTAQRYFLCPLLFLCAVDSVWAVDRSRHISQYERTAWRGQDGVFSGSPNAISQTTDGYLRIGTQAGLVKSACLADSAWKVTILGLLAGDSGYLLISSPKLWEDGTAVWRFRPPLFARRCRQVIRVLNFLNTSETIEFILDFSTGDAGWVNICELRSVGF